MWEYLAKFFCCYLDNRPNRKQILFVYRRRKRAVPSNVTESNDDEYILLPPGAIDQSEPADIPGPEGLHGNATWPTPTGITRDAATTTCETPIRDLPIYDVCEAYTATQRQFIIDSCVLDIQVGWRNYRISTLDYTILFYVTAFNHSAACIAYSVNFSAAQRRSRVKWRIPVKTRNIAISLRDRAT